MVAPVLILFIMPVRSLSKLAFAAVLAGSTLVQAKPIARQEANTCTTINQRKSWTALTDSEKSAYIDAELCLQALPAQLADTSNAVTGAQNRWDEIHYTHIVQTNVIHNVGAFLPWHRLFVRAHEVLLQQECGYTGAQPYWDERSDIEQINNGTLTIDQLVVFDNQTGFGGNGRSEDGCVTDGPFANLTLHLNSSGLPDESGGYCLSRSFDLTSLERGDGSEVETCYAYDTFEDARQCYESDPHAAGHGGVGGVMINVAASPGDPIFFLHHAYIDRLWWQWQQANLTSRLTDISGPNVPSDDILALGNLSYPTAAVLDYDGDSGNVTTLNHTLWMVNLIANATAGDVMDLGGSTSCAEYV